ncbi:MAG: TonB-dependent receptor [Desulfobacterales bacterium]
MKNIWKKWALWIGIAVIGFSGTAIGEESKADDGMETVMMEELVVTATRYEEDLDAIPANITVITETDIDNTAAYNIPDMLRSQVGLHVNDITGNRRSYTVDIRGYGETAALNTLVLVDGRRINAADLSGTDWTIIPLDRVNRIEIIRGGRSSILYGDNASGGVINIITKEGEAFKAGADVNVGSYDMYGGSAFVSGAGGDLSYSVSGNVLTADGYRNNSNTESKAFGAHLRYYPGDALRWHLSAGYNEDQTRLPGALKTSDFAGGVSRIDTIQPDDFADVEDYYIMGGPEIYFTNNSRVKIEASLRKRQSTSFATFAGGSFTGTTDIETVIVSPQIIVKEEILGIDNNLIVGVDYVDSEEDIVNESIFFGVESRGDFTLGKENIGYFIHEEMEPTEGLSLSAGYRYDRAKFSFRPSVPSEATLDDNLFTTGASYRLNPSVTTYFSYSKSFRYPVLDELFNFFFNTVDASLQPQSSQDYEAGIRYSFNDHLRGNINFFQIDTEEEIYFDPAFYVNTNLDGETRRRGMELYLYGNFGKADISASYAYTDTEIRGGQFDGKSVPNVPAHKMTLAGRYVLGNGFSVAANGVYVGGRRFVSDFPNAYDDQKDYFVLNAKVTYERGLLTAFLDLNNITNKEYSEYGVLGGWPVEEALFPSPEFNVLFGVSINLGSSPN